MEKYIGKIKELSAGRTVVMPAFGDAESMATAAVCVAALGSDKVSAVHIDHGMLRLGEKEAVRASLKAIGVKKIIFVTLEKFISVSTVRTDDGRVAGPLSTTCDPFEKRYVVATAIEKEYRKAVAENFNGDILSVGVHGIGGDSLDISADAVRIARAAGAAEWLLRQPFPLQALAIRMICNDSSIALTTAQREALAELTSTVGGREFASKLVPFRSVGVRDGVRSYKSMAVLSNRAADSDFVMAANIADAIDKKLPFVNRVLCRVDCDEKAPTYHGSPMHISKETLDAVRIADKIVSEEFAVTSATQFFGVLLPFVADRTKKYSVAIRAVVTDDYKTAEALIPDRAFDRAVLRRTAARIKAEQPYIDMVLYDLTSKPPAAIEFE